MSGVIAFAASSTTPTGGRVLTHSDRAAMDFRSGGFQPPNRELEAPATSLNRELEAPATEVFCLPGDTLAAEYAAAAGRSAILFNEIESLPQFDIAWVGGGFLEQTGDDFAARLAEQRAASLIFDVIDATRGADGVLRIVRAARAGARDVIEVSGPAVLGVSEFAPRPGYVSSYRRQQARRRLMIVAAEVPTADWQPVRPRTRRSAGLAAPGRVEERMDAAFGITELIAAATDQPIIADPNVCAEHLVRYLAHHGFLQRGLRSGGFQPPNRELEAPATSSNRELEAPATGILAGASGALNSAVARRPRLVGKPRRTDRGPRRIRGSTTSS